MLQLQWGLYNIFSLGHPYTMRKILNFLILKIIHEKHFDIQMLIVQEFPHGWQHQPFELAYEALQFIKE
jgi:hypothetical protein